MSTHFPAFMSLRIVEANDMVREQRGGAVWGNGERVGGGPHHVTGPEADWVNGECVSDSPRESGNDALTIMGGSPWQKVKPAHTTGNHHPGWLKIDWLGLVNQAASFSRDEKWGGLTVWKLGRVGGVSQVSAA